MVRVNCLTCIWLLLSVERIVETERGVTGEQREREKMGDTVREIDRDRGKEEKKEGWKRGRERETKYAYSLTVCLCSVIAANALQYNV